MPKNDYYSNRVTKAELLNRIKAILNDLKKTITHSKFLGEEVENLEIEISEIEKQYAKLVDDFMASVIRQTLMVRKYGKRDRF